MNEHLFDSGTRNGTAGGTLITIIGNIHEQDVVKTIVLASIGAIVSFGVSLLLKMVIRRFKR